MLPICNSVLARWNAWAKFLRIGQDHFDGRVLSGRNRGAGKPSRIARVPVVASHIYSHVPPPSHRTWNSHVLANCLEKNPESTCPYVPQVLRSPASCDISQPACYTSSSALSGWLVHLDFWSLSHSPRKLFGWQVQGNVAHPFCKPTQRTWHSKLSTASKLSLKQCSWVLQAHLKPKAQRWEYPQSRKASLRENILNTSRQEEVTWVRLAAGPVTAQQQSTRLVPVWGYWESQSFCLLVYDLFIPKS